MIEDKLKLNTFNLDYFMQWGTPEDLRSTIGIQICLNLRKIKTKIKFT